MPTYGRRVFLYQVCRYAQGHVGYIGGIKLKFDGKKSKTHGINGELRGNKPKTNGKTHKSVGINLPSIPIAQKNNSSCRYFGRTKNGYAIIR